MEIWSVSLSFHRNKCLIVLEKVVFSIVFSSQFSNKGIQTCSFVLAFRKFLWRIAVFSQRLTHKIPLRGIFITVLQYLNVMLLFKAFNCCEEDDIRMVVIVSCYLQGRTAHIQCARDGGSRWRPTYWIKLQNIHTNLWIQHMHYNVFIDWVSSFWFHFGSLFAL